MVGGGGGGAAAVGLQWTVAATSLQQSFQVESITSQSAASMSTGRDMGTFCEKICPYLVANPRSSGQRRTRCRQDSEIGYYGVWLIVILERRERRRSAQYRPGTNDNDLQKPSSISDEPVVLPSVLAWPYYSIIMMPKPWLRRSRFASEAVAIHPPATSAMLLYNLHISS